MNRKNMYKAIVAITVVLVFVLPGVDAILNDEKAVNNEMDIS